MAGKAVGSGLRNTQVKASGRALGFVETPAELVQWMVALAAPQPGWRVLEPACGAAPFLKALEDARCVLTGSEINPESLAHLQAQAWFQEGEPIELHRGDFLLWDTPQRFDLIIGNPPYGIVGDKSHYPIHALKERKDLYQKRFETWRGKYNLYGAFMEQGVRLLKPEGQMVFVVPATWLVLDDFSRLRRYLASHGRLEVYYVGRIFPKRNVTAVVLRFLRGGHGLALYDKGYARAPLLLEQSSYQGEMIGFETPETKRFERSGIPLEELFSIHFASRSTHFKVSPLTRETPLPGDVPVLTGRNLKFHVLGKGEGVQAWIDYETCYSSCWMRLEDASSMRAFYGIPHIIVGHTKGTRVVAVVDEKCYPWREEFHLVPKREGLPLYAIASYLNSAEVQHYVQTLYRDFVPHLTTSMLKRVPVRLERCKGGQVQL